MRKVFKWAIENRILSSNDYPFEGKQVKFENGRKYRRKRYPKDQEYEIIKENLPDFLKPVIVAIKETGARVESEILELTWDKVDLNENFIKLEIQDTKEKYAKNIPISPELRDVFLKLKKVVHLNGENRVFTTPEGKAVSYAMLRHHWDKICKEKDLDITRHDFRRKFCTDLRDAGIDTKPG